MSIDIEEMKKRRDAVDTALGITLTAAPMPNQRYLDALDDYVAGKITLEELDENVHNLKYLYVNSVVADI